MKFLMNQYSLVLILSLSMVLFSCGEDKPADETANDNLSGTWVVNSYTISGQEAIGSTVESAELNFTTSDVVSGTFSYISLGPSSNRSSTYTVVDDGNRIKIGTDTLDLNVSESNLDIEGFWFASVGDAIKITATK